MPRFDPTRVTVWEPDIDAPLCRWAVRADEATAEQAVAAVARQFAIDRKALRYVGVQVWNLSYDEEHRGRRRRAHIVGLASEAGGPPPPSPLPL